MLGQAIKSLATYSPYFSQKNDLMVATVPDTSIGFSLAQELLSLLVDKQTVLFLSGGRTPKQLYENMTKTEQVIPGAAALIDERYGDSFHINSNERMIEESGLLAFFASLGIPFYSILQYDTTREEATKLYELYVKELLHAFHRKIGILGIGQDGHTAGIPVLKAPDHSLFTTDALVATYNDQDGMYGERITMTFSALSELDVFIVVVFGEDKQTPLQNIFEEGTEENIPGRFYRRPDIAKRTLIITDRVL